MNKKKKKRGSLKGRKSRKWRWPSVVHNGEMKHKIKIEMKKKINKRVESKSKLKRKSKIEKCLRRHKAEEGKQRATVQGRRTSNDFPKI